MLFVDNRNINDPRLNLALEEYLLRHVREEAPLLLFYINEPAVIIGRNQNTLEEIDPDYVKEEGIHVVRRLSGGGAVFHDLGNLNFSFITSDHRNIHNFEKFTEPVIGVLNKMGVPAELRGTSDIFVENRKISGNAQFAGGGRMFSHGTILFDTSIETMLKALNPRQVEIQSKAVQSVRNFVANVRDYLGEAAGVTIEDLKQAILGEIFDDGPVATFDLDETDWELVERLAAERYFTWDWNYGRSPKYNLRKTGTLDAGKFDVRLEVDKGRIRNLVIYGNFPSRRDIDDLTGLLIGKRHDPEVLRRSLATVDLRPYLGPVGIEQLVDLLY